MKSDDEKDPPVPADLEGAPKRIHREKDAESHEESDLDAAADDLD